LFLDEGSSMSVQSRISISPTSSWLGRVRQTWQHGDWVYRVLLFFATLLVVSLVAAIGYQLWTYSALARQTFGWKFIITTDWDPALNKTFGALPFILGTLITSIIALVVAIPLSLGTAMFLAELAPTWLRQPLGFFVELLAAVPSVVYGLWGLFVYIPVFVRPLADGLNKTFGFLPLFTGPVFGPSRLAAGLLLAIMIFPTITAVSRDVFLAIPNSQREAALALGSTRWETIWQVLMPYGLSGLLGAMILGLGRALGETIAVTMVIGNNLDLSASLLHPGYTMASIIANEFTEATYDLYVQSLIEIGLILFVLTLFINLIARFLIWRVARRLNVEVRS
jgi:phosphate transport system permease protein